MWTKNGNLLDGTKTWQEALDYITSINSGSGICSHRDWRLPNINELESLANAGDDSSTWLDSQGFNRVQPDVYWSSTTPSDSKKRGDAWIVDTWDGSILNNTKSNSYYVWPVRSGQKGDDNRGR